MKKLIKKVVIKKVVVGHSMFWCARLNQYET